MPPENPSRSSPARVLLVITDSGIGGTEKIVAMLACGLDPSRFHPIICSVKPPGEMADRVREKGVEFFSLELRKEGLLTGAARSLKLTGELAGEIRGRKVDLVHSFLFLANMIGRFAARRTGRPHISSTRTEEREKGYHHLAERLTRGLVDLYITPSRQVADFAVSRAGLPPEKMVVVPNAVEAPVSLPPTLRPRLGLDEKTPLIGFVGRLHRQKGPDLLLRAFDRLPGDSQAHLVVIGDGPEKLNLQEEARRLKRTERIHFTGWIPGASALLGELDLLVLPSRTEGTPNIALEAMASRVPVLAAAVGGVTEILEDGKTGFLFPPGDTRSLFQTMGDIIEGRYDLEGIAGEAESKVVKEHRPEVMIERYQSIYEELLGVRR
jgi:glycosyltransferase involved in cell wall biosynthesis